MKIVAVVAVVEAVVVYRIRVCIQSFLAVVAVTAAVVVLVYRTRVCNQSFLSVFLSGEL